MVRPVRWQRAAAQQRGRLATAYALKQSSSFAERRQRMRGSVFACRVAAVPAALARMVLDCEPLALGHRRPDCFGRDRSLRPRLGRIVERHRIQHCSERIRLDCSSLVVDIGPVVRLSAAAPFGVHNFASLDLQ